MRRTRLCVFMLLSALAIAAATTQRAAAQAPKPYAAVAITLPPPFADDKFTAFRNELAAAAKRRRYDDLKGLVARQGFFWERDFGRRFDPQRPAVDNLAVAVALEGEDGAGWKTLAAFAEETSAEPQPSRPGVVCAPARAAFDGVAFSRLLDATNTAVDDWAYPHADGIPARATTAPGAATTGVLGLSFVRLLGFEGATGAGDPERTRWARVAMPDATIGFVPPGSLMSLGSEQLCYVKDGTAGWRIAGFVARRN